MLAARAGVRQLSGLCFEELRAISKVFLEDRLRGAIALSDHRGDANVTVEDVLGSAADGLALGCRTSTLQLGTGRLGAVLRNHCTPHPEASIDWAVCVTPPIHGMHASDT